MSFIFEWDDEKALRCYSKVSGTVLCDLAEGRPWTLLNTNAVISHSMTGNTATCIAKYLHGWSIDS